MRFSKIEMVIMASPEMEGLVMDLQVQQPLLSQF